METVKSGNHTFEVVESVPEGFAVWNIGPIDDAGEYLPLFEPLHPGDPDDRAVNTETLKAVKVAPDAASRMLGAASWDVRTLKDAERAAASKRKGFISNNRREKAAAALDDFKKLWGRDNRGIIGGERSAE